MLAYMPYSTGDMQIEQAIIKAGNWRVSGLMLELAWRVAESAHWK
jgi:hypothetical protein